MSIRALDKYVNKNNFLLFALVTAVFFVQVLTGLLAILVPAHITLISFFLISLLILFLKKPRISLYLLVIMIPVGAGTVVFYNDTDSRSLLMKTCSIPPEAIFAFIAAIAWYLRGVASEGFRNLTVPSPINPILLFIFLLLLWTTITLIWTPHTYIGLFQLVILVINFGILLLFGIGVNDKQTLQRLSWTWLILGVILSILCFVFLWTLAIEQGAVEGKWARYSTEFMLGPNVIFQAVLGIHENRGSALMHPNAMAMIMNLIVAFGFGLLCTPAVGRTKKIMIVFILVFVVAAQVTTASKAGTSSLFLMVFFFLFAFKVLRKRFFICGLMFVFLYCAIFIGTNIFVFLRTGGDVASSRLTSIQVSFFETRLIWWKGILDQFVEQAPGLGLGIGASKYYLSPESGSGISDVQIPHLHSIYLSGLFDLGVVSVIIIFVLMLVLAWQSVPFLKTEQNTLPKNILIASWGAVLALGVHGLVDFDYNTTIIYIVLGILIAALKLSKGELSDPNVRTI